MKRQQHWYLVGALATGMAVGFVWYLWDIDSDLSENAISVSDNESTNAASKTLSLVSPGVQSVGGALSDPSLSNEAEEFQYDVVNPYGSGTASWFSLERDNIKERFFEHIEQARNGDADAMLMVSDLIYNCARSPTTEQAIADLLANALIDQAGHDRMLYLNGECAEVREEMRQNFPDEVDAIRYGIRHYLVEAARAGNKLAALRFAVKPTESLYEAARLADEIVDTLDYRVFYQISIIVAQAGADNDKLESDKWNLLACKYHPECDFEIAIGNLDHYLYVGQKEEVMSFAENFKSIGDHEYSISSYVMDRHHGEQVPRVGRQLEIELQKIREKQEEAQNSLEAEQ